MTKNLALVALIDFICSIRTLFNQRYYVAVFEQVDKLRGQGKSSLLE